jgi:hypothetical protein
MRYLTFGLVGARWPEMRMRVRRTRGEILLLSACGNMVWVAGIMVGSSTVCHGITVAGVDLTKVLLHSDVRRRARFSH